MKKKAILGLDTVKAVIVLLLVMAVITIVMFAAISPLRDATETIDKGETLTKVNETLTSVDEVGEKLAAITLRNVACTVSQCINSTDSLIIPAVNYTATGCTVKYSGITGNYNATNWKCTYTYTYDNPGANAIVQNMTNAPTLFFNNVPTFFTLLGVVILILIISIVIASVTRFTGGEGMSAPGPAETLRDM